MCITFSSRRDTPLYRLKTASQRVRGVLIALAEGRDVSAAVRVFGEKARHHHEVACAGWYASLDDARPLVAEDASAARTTGRDPNAAAQPIS